MHTKSCTLNWINIIESTLLCSIYPQLCWGLFLLLFSILFVFFKPIYAQYLKRFFLWIFMHQLFKPIIFSAQENTHLASLSPREAPKEAKKKLKLGHQKTNYPCFFVHLQGTFNPDLISRRQKFLNIFGFGSTPPYFFKCLSSSKKILINFRLGSSPTIRVCQGKMVTSIRPKLWPQFLLGMLLKNGEKNCCPPIAPEVDIYNGNNDGQKWEKISSF